MERGMKMKIKMQRLLRKLFYIGAIGISIVLLFFVIICVWIGYDVKIRCQDAKRLYDKTDCVEALVILLNDETKGYRARNTAIWALGQLGDKRALPTAEILYRRHSSPRAVGQNHQPIRTQEGGQSDKWRSECHGGVLEV